MSFWERLFRLLFGRRQRAQPAPAPQPTRSLPQQQPAQPPPPPPPPPPPLRTPQPIRIDPITPVEPGKEEEPIAVPVLTPVAAVVPDLEELRVEDAARLSDALLAAAAGRLQIEVEAVQAVVRVESAGSGFGPDGRPLILFDPGVFSRLTGGRFDADAPEVSMAQVRAGALGRTQQERWGKLAQAYRLDSGAALAATSWGLFQIAGADHRDAGFSDVFSFARAQAQSEERQLATFEAIVRTRNLSGPLREQDWETFARIYNGEAGVARYAQALAEAYRALQRGRGGNDGFLSGLKARDASPLTPAQIAASAQRLGAEDAAVSAVLKVESRGSGFGADGRPIILYEPHIFSRLTNAAYNDSHPTIAYQRWRERPYPRTQAERYAQLAQAYSLDPEAALSSASWGLFQILGSNHRACGFPTASAFTADISISHERQLIAFEAFVRANNILDALQKRDWARFARVYNGPGQVETYSRLLANAYAEAGGLSPQA